MGGDLAGTGVHVAAAAVGQHQPADVQFGGAVQDRFAYGEHDVLLLHAVDDVHRDIGLRVQGGNHEPVDRINRLFTAEGEYDHLAVQRRPALDLLLGLRIVFEVQLDTLLD